MDKENGSGEGTILTTSPGKSMKQEMKRELLRKDELIKKHYEKLGDWQALLQDMQGASSTNLSSTGNTNNVNTGNTSAITGSSSRVGGNVGVTPGMSIPNQNENFVRKMISI